MSIDSLVTLYHDKAVRSPIVAFHQTLKTQYGDLADELLLVIEQISIQAGTWPEKKRPD